MQFHTFFNVQTHYLVRNSFWISKYLDHWSSSIDVFRKGTYLVPIRTISSLVLFFVFERFVVQTVANMNNLILCYFCI